MWPVHTMVFQIARVEAPYHRERHTLWFAGVADFMLNFGGIWLFLRFSLPNTPDVLQAWHGL